MYEYILSKHNNDCIPLVVEDPNKKFLLGIRLNKNGKLTGNVYNERGFHELKTDFQINNAIKIMKEKCKKRFIAVPLEIPGHLNMLIIDLKDNTAERFEPHGSGYRGRGGGEALDEKVNETIKNLIENEWKLTYIPPSGICPFKKGFQAIEQDSKKHNEVLIDEYNKYIAKQGGLCALWSYIYLDLRLSNPNKTPKEIFDKALKGGGISPDLLKKWSVIYAKKVLSPISNKVEELIIEEANDLGKIDKAEMKEYLENVNPLKFLHYLSTSRDGKINLSYKKGKKKIKIDNPNNLKKWTLYSSIHIILVRMILNKIMNSSLQIKIEPKKLKEPKPEPFDKGNDYNSLKQEIEYWTGEWKKRPQGNPPKEDDMKDFRKRLMIFKKTDKGEKYEELKLKYDLLWKQGKQQFNWGEKKKQ